MDFKKELEKFILQWIEHYLKMSHIFDFSGSITFHFEKGKYQKSEIRKIIK